MANIKLISVFNHRYDKNIPILRKYYDNKFYDMQFLVPFYDGNDKDVISVTKNVSFNFSGYFYEGFEHFYDTKVDYYLFLADDALLNPAYNQSNILDILAPNKEKIYTTQIINLNSPNKLSWAHAPFSNLPFRYLSKNFNKILPDYNEMADKMKKFFDGYDTKIDPSYDKKILDNNPVIATRRSNIYNFTKRQDGKVIYPLAYGWSDIVMVHKSLIYEFVKYCGIFAAAKIFCEIAIPTAIVCTANKKDVSTLFKIGNKQLVLWDDERDNFANKYNKNFIDLINHYPKDSLLVHPVKLSQWYTEKYLQGVN